MPKYTIFAKNHIYLKCEVEANTPDEAREQIGLDISKFKQIDTFFQITDIREED